MDKERAPTRLCSWKRSQGRTRARRGSTRSDDANAEKEHAAESEEDDDEEDV